MSKIEGKNLVDNVFDKLERKISEGHFEPGLKSQLFSMTQNAREEIILALRESLHDLKRKLPEDISDGYHDERLEGYLIGIDAAITALLGKDEPTKTDTRRPGPYSFG